MIRLSIKWDSKDFDTWTQSRIVGLRDWGKGKIQGANAMFTAVEQYHRQLFATRGAEGAGRASGYGPWEALRLRTLKARAMRQRMSRIPPGDYATGAGSDRILQWSQRLYTSLTTQGNRYGDSIRIAHSQGMTFGTSTPTALFHKAGRAGKNPMPVRVPLDDIIGAEVAVEVAHAKILAFLFTE